MPVSVDQTLIVADPWVRPQVLTDADRRGPLMGADRAELMGVDRAELMGVDRTEPAPRDPGSAETRTAAATETWASFSTTAEQGFLEMRKFQRSPQKDPL